MVLISSKVVLTTLLILYRFLGCVGEQEGEVDKNLEQVCGGLFQAISVFLQESDRTITRN
jgi:hypothetical protein